MPQGQYRRPRINFGIEEASKEQLEEWAKSEKRTVSNLIETIVEEALNSRLGPKTNLLAPEDLDQIKKFIALLCGDRTERNGISFVLLGQTLGIDPEKLHALYELVKQCRNQDQHKGKIKK